MSAKKELLLDAATSQEQLGTDKFSNQILTSDKNNVINIAQKSGNKNPFLEAALVYSEAGLQVLPLKPASKEPATKHGVYDATSDAEQIKRWWTENPHYNIGIRPTELPDGDFIGVMDIDPLNGGSDSLAKLIEQCGSEITDTLTFLSGRGGGKHCYLRIPADRAKKSNALGKGIDFISDNGYVVAPPSIHPETKLPYKFDDDTADIIALVGIFPIDQIKAAPARLIAKLPSTLASAPATATKARPEGGSLASVTPATIEDLRSALRFINNDYDNKQVKYGDDLWARIGRSLHGLGDDGFALFDEWSRNSVMYKSEYSARRAEKKWKTFTNTHSLKYQTVFAEAKKLGWVNPRRHSNAVSVADDFDVLPNGERGNLPRIHGMDSRHGTVDTLPLTEAGNAWRLQDLLKASVRYVTGTGSWLVWEDGHWEWNDGSRIYESAMNLSMVIYKEAEHHFDDAKRFADWGLKSQDKRVIESSVSLLKNLGAMRVSPDCLDTDPFVVGINGGRQKIDLKTGAVSDAVPTDYITKTLNVDQLGDADKAVRWKQFLTEIFAGDAELIEWVQRFAGYMLTGATTEQLFLFLYGKGSNGKGVFTETLMHIMGDYGRPADKSLFSGKPRDTEAASPELAALIAVRAAFCSETDEGANFSVATVKAVTAGDMITARKLHSEPQSFNPAFKLVISGNHALRTNAHDAGFWRRLVVIPFPCKFDATNEAFDFNLKDKLIAEKPHILAWMLEGCLHWQQKPLKSTLPKVVKAANSDYQQEQDVIQEFLDDCTAANASEKVTKQAMYNAYVDWCKNNGHRFHVSKRTLTNVLKEKGFNQDAGKRNFIGISLNHGFEDSLDDDLI